MTLMNSLVDSIWPTKIGEEQEKSIEILKTGIHTEKKNYLINNKRKRTFKNRLTISKDVTYT